VARLGGPADPVVISLDRLKERHTAMVMEAAERYGWK
jgi:hypothetical protein